MNTEQTLQDLPLALDHWDEVVEALSGREPAVFLDYDGTLTPIVDDPAAATIPPGTKQAVERLMSQCTVAVVSGRDLDDVRDMVGIEGLHYAGSHGFDILAPDGERLQKGKEFLPALDQAEEQLSPRLDDIGGARLERKRFAIAVHYRQVDDTAVPEVERAVREVGDPHDDLRVTGGKRIFELRPALDWDKGKALRHLLETLDLDRPDVVPMYLGDDDTDEDGFRALGDEGVGLVVRGEADQRPTAADFALRDTDEARVVLERLAEHLERSP
ncbi:MAG: trehalose-phosphatase [Nitriliruptorales bacterium]|nr:trehalose-phosphatase [Nitriliruptorales bacterium]